MAVLHNRINNEELKQRMLAETEKRITISFYRYFNIPNPQFYRDFFYKRLNELKVFGRVYIAAEGINAQISVPESKMDTFKSFLESTEDLKNLRLNIAIDDDGKSFWVLKVKLRPKIVADGIDDPTFDMANKGGYVDAATMNKMVDNGDTVIIDMRNHYEYEVGHFQNALEVPSDTFRDQLPLAVDILHGKEDKNIIMYCTGGIRCEKASAFMLHKGFKNVFHLEGGIINYARQLKEIGEDSKFIGKNFVFDDRLGERITEDIISYCHQCGKPCDTHTNCENNGCHLLFIQCDSCKAEYEGCCSKECKDTIHLPVDRQKEIRKGEDLGQNIFNKSKSRLRPRLNEKE